MSERWVIEQVGIIIREWHHSDPVAEAERVNANEGWTVNKSGITFGGTVRYENTHLSEEELTRAIMFAHAHEVHPR